MLLIETLGQLHTHTYRAAESQHLSTQAQRHFSPCRWRVKFGSQPLVGAVDPFVYISLEQRVNISYLREHSFRVLPLLLDTNIAGVFAGEVALYFFL